MTDKAHCSHCGRYTDVAHYVVGEDGDGYVCRECALSDNWPSLKHLWQDDCSETDGVPRD